MRLKVAEQIKKYSSVTKEFDLLKLFNAKSCCHCYSYQQNLLCYCYRNLKTKKISFAKDNYTGLVLM